MIKSINNSATIVKYITYFGRDIGDFCNFWPRRMKIPAYVPALLVSLSVSLKGRTQRVPVPLISVNTCNNTGCIPSSRLTGCAASPDQCDRQEGWLLHATQRARL